MAAAWSSRLLEHRRAFLLGYPVEQRTEAERKRVTDWLATRPASVAAR